MATPARCVDGGAATIIGMPRPQISVIAAVARNAAIGKANKLLVHLPDDLPRFKRLTSGSAVIMGRKTWDSIGRPLPGRRSIVVTRDPHWCTEGAEGAPSLAAAIERVTPASRVFVIGGSQLYAQALPIADELLLTEIDAEFEADTYFPPWDRAGFQETLRETRTSPEGLTYSFVTYIKKRST